MGVHRKRRGACAILRRFHQPSSSACRLLAADTAFETLEPGVPKSRRSRRCCPLETIFPPCPRPLQRVSCTILPAPSYSSRCPSKTLLHLTWREDCRLELTRLRFKVFPRNDTRSKTAVAAGAALAAQARSNYARLRTDCPFQTLSFLSSKFSRSYHFLYMQQEKKTSFHFYVHTSNSASQRDFNATF